VLSSTDSDVTLSEVWGNLNTALGSASVHCVWGTIISAVRTTRNAPLFSPAPPVHLMLNTSGLSGSWGKDAVTVSVLSDDVPTL
jgi:hypothetical protein